MKGADVDSWGAEEISKALVITMKRPKVNEGVRRKVQAALGKMIGTQAYILKEITWYGMQDGEALLDVDEVWLRETSGVAAQRPEDRLREPTSEEEEYPEMIFLDLDDEPGETCGRGY